MKKAYARPSLGKVRLMTEEAVLVACYSDPAVGGQNGPGSLYNDCEGWDFGCLEYSC